MDQAHSVKLVFTERAAGQIDEIVRYIAGQSPQSARRVRDRIRVITTLIAQHPYMGQKTDLDGVRRLTATPYPYIVFYRVRNDSVIIQRVRHTSRDPSSMPGRA